MLLLGAFELTFSQQAVPSSGIAESTLMEHVHYLASERLAGRAAGTEGEELAAEYLEKQLEDAGVEPLPPKLRRQRFGTLGPKGPVQSQNVVGWIEGQMML
jgi:hypothetical protein